MKMNSNKSGGRPAADGKMIDELSKLQSQPICASSTAHISEKDLNRENAELQAQLTEIREKLQRNEEHFRSVLDNSLDAIYRLNLKTRHYEYFSPSCLEVYGYSPGEMIGMSEQEALDHIHPEDRPIVEELLTEMLTSGRAVIEFRWISKTGEYKWLSAHSTLVRDPSGQPWYRNGITRDISVRKTAEEALRRSAARLQLLSNCASRLLSTENPQNIVNELCQEVMTHLDCQAFFNFMADDKARKLHLNAAAGIPDEEIRKIEWLEYGVAVCGCAAQERCRIIAEDILNNRDPRTDLVKSYGIQAYCCHPLVAQGRVIGTLSFGTTNRPSFTQEEVEVMRTIADQVSVAMQRVINQRAMHDLNESLEQRVAERTAEVKQQAERLHALAAELSQAEQRERKRLATILHDHIQQLLVAAQMHLSLVKHADSSRLEPAIQGVQSIIREAIDASRSLAVDLSPPILHQGGLGPGLGWLATRMEKKNLFKIRVRADSDAEPASEPMRLLLFESVRELLLNAVKHSGAHEANVTMIRTPENWTRITVADNGGGFDPEAAGSHPSGLGLFGIQQRLTYMGGRFEIDSAPGRGTRVTLMAPLEKPDRESLAPEVKAPKLMEKGHSASRPDNKKICILLVDDHSIVRKGLSSLLQLEPDLEIVAEAQDGEQALELAGHFTPDVVVTDVSLPGMDGVALTRALRRKLPGIKVLGLSMHIEKDIAEAMREAGAAGYLTKGGLLEDLIEAIRACVAAR
jgi:PAS domain S-box-containing protein